MLTLASLTNIAGPDMIIILLIVLVLFGAKRLPELAKGMGQAVREFHKAKEDFGQELHSATTSEVRQPIAPPVTEPASDASVASEKIS